MYVNRDGSGNIIEVFAAEQFAGQEFVQLSVINAWKAANAASAINKSGFVSAMNVSLGGIVAANNYAKLYPLFMPSFDSNDWANASALLVDALNTAAITSTQYAAIKADAATYNIPLSLP